MRIILIRIFGFGCQSTLWLREAPELKIGLRLHQSVNQAGTLTRGFNESDQDMGFARARGLENDREMLRTPLT